MTRPERLSITAENGRPMALQEGEGQFEALGAGDQLVVLGLGPDPALLAELLPAEGVFYVEHPDFEAAMPARWVASIPATWERIGPERAETALGKGCRVLIYRPNLRLFPSFWGRLWAKAQVASIAPGPATAEVWLPARETSLLAAELTDAFEQAGFSVRHLDPGHTATAIPRLLREATPALFLSVNFAGLDAWGETFRLLQAAGTPVAVWCGDNPLHLLSGLRAGFWRETLVCITDDSFTAPLMELGARAVAHLPLAAWPRFAATAQPGEHADLRDRLVFVGRSEFPDRAGFFSGIQLPPDARETALRMIARGQRPDYAWWLRVLDAGPLWPGRAAREPGLGAEESAQAMRAACLRACARSLPLTVYGDDGWDALVPELSDRRDPVDYYGPLAGIYAAAGAVLNVTSLLLPAGLTQRHFDVWAAGGFLLSDATPGLGVIPVELSRPISFAKPEEAVTLFGHFAAHPEERADLAGAWREHILAHHTYAHRVRTVLDLLGISAP